MLIYQNTGLLIYSCVLAAVTGAVFGSFLNCAAWRIAHQENFMKGRSHCTSCGHPLGMMDLIPVFSWLLLGGKCRYCGEKIPWRYMAAELFMGAMSVLCLLQCDISVLFVRNLLFGSCLFCLSLVDMEIYEIPDGCLIISAAVWGIYEILRFFGLLGLAPAGFAPIISGLTGGIVIAGGMLGMTLLMDKILKRESMGGGDIKLFFVTGLYLGLAGNYFALLLACLIGLLFAVIVAKRSKDGKKYAAIPFGPSISIAVWIMLLYGEPFIEWYLSLIL